MDNIHLRTGTLRRYCLAVSLAFTLACGPVSKISATPPEDRRKPAEQGEFQDTNILLTKFKQSREDRKSRRSANTGASSAEAKRVAIADLPLKKLSPAARLRVKKVVTSSGMFRRMPTIIFASDPNAYEFFVYHPDVAVSMWRAMQISKLQLWQTGRFEYEGDAHDGTIGTLDVLYQSPNLNLIYCEGEFKSPLIPKTIKAKSVILLRTGYSQEKDGRVYITHSADLYVSFPSQTVESIAKILSPVSGRIADRTFSEISLFMKMMSMAMSKRPGWVEKIVAKMEGIPDLRRKQLMQVTARIYAAELKRRDQNQRTAAKRPKPTGPSGAQPTRSTAKSADRTNPRTR